MLNLETQIITLILIRDIHFLFNIHNNKRRTNNNNKKKLNINSNSNNNNNRVNDSNVKNGAKYEQLELKLI